jgi:hypothetical protein
LNFTKDLELNAAIKKIYFEGGEDNLSENNGDEIPQLNKDEEKYLKQIFD